MKQSLLCLFSVLAVYATSAFSQAGAPNLNPVHVATALNHLTVLEFHEPVTMAAAGSSDFQIERQDDKVFIKPMKAGASTDLFVWTASRHFAYELETTPEVKDMSVSIDNPVIPPVETPNSVLNAHIDDVADMILTRAFLGTVQISLTTARVMKGQVSVRVQQVFRTRTSLYIHYTIENNSKSVYRVTSPDAFELRPARSSLSLLSLAHKQLDPRLLGKLIDVENISLLIAHAESGIEDLAPGESTDGVVAIRQNLSSPAVVQLVFDSQVKATFVL